MSIYESGAGSESIKPIESKKERKARVSMEREMVREIKISEHQKYCDDLNKLLDGGNIVEARQLYDDFLVKSSSSDARIGIKISTNLAARNAVLFHLENADNQWNAERIIKLFFNNNYFSDGYTGKTAEDFIGAAEKGFRKFFDIRRGVDVLSAVDFRNKYLVQLPRFELREVKDALRKIEAEPGLENKKQLVELIKKHFLS